MKKRIVTICGIVLFILGLLILFNATKIGMSIADNAVLANGGAIDTEKFYFIMQSNTLSYQIAGAIMAVIGGLTSIVFGYRNEKH